MLAESLHTKLRHLSTSGIIHLYFLTYTPQNNTTTLEIIFLRMYNM